MKKIAIAFISLVLLEMATLIFVGNQIGVLYTLLLIILMGIFGVFIAKKQGVHSFQDIRNSIANGQPPGIVMIDTFLIFVGGILFVIPGFITDLIGLSLLVPVSRNLYKPAILNWLRKKMKNGQVVIIQK